MSHAYPIIQAIHRWLAMIAVICLHRAEEVTPPTDLDNTFTIDEDLPHVFSLWSLQNGNLPKFFRVIVTH